MHELVNGKSPYEVIKFELIWKIPQKGKFVFAI